MALNFANNNSLSAITSLPASISGGGMTLLSTQTASSSSTISFTSGIDSTYDEYVFKFINIHPNNDGDYFSVNFSADSGSNYNVTKTTTYFHGRHGEDGSNAELAYQTSYDLAQGTGIQNLGEGVGGDNDQSINGTLHLFSPSNTTFVKHFMSRCANIRHNNQATDVFVAGYCNTTSAIDAVQFKFNSNNIDSGVIKLYGIS